MMRLLVLVVVVVLVVFARFGSPAAPAAISVDHVAEDESALHGTSEDLLRQLFEELLDTDGNGRLSADELERFLGALADGYAVPVDQLAEFVQEMDPDGDELVDWEEFVRFFHDQIKCPKRYATSMSPEQVHISLTSMPSDVKIMWVTMDETENTVLRIGEASGQYTMQFTGEQYTYDVGVLGWDGWIHKVRATGLKPGTWYYYQVGDDVSGEFSPEFNFHTAPDPNERFPDGLRFFTGGDMGTFMPFGFLVEDAIADMHYNEKRFDMGWHLGDISYAGTGSTREWEKVWDLYFRMIEPLASTFPYMTVVGNHEKYYNFTAFSARFDMSGDESGGWDNFYYSIDYGPVHFISLCCEDYIAPYQPGSEQHNWLIQDLEKANANRDKVPWIVAGSHRPFYGTTQNGGWEGIRQAWEYLFMEYKVDVFFAGHVHCYERTWPMYNNSVVDTYDDPQRYTNPNAPVHLTIGTTGALVIDHWVSDPEWLVARQLSYGFGLFEIIEGGTTLHFQYHSNREPGLADEFYIVKDLKKKH